VDQVCLAAAGRCDRPGGPCASDATCCGTEGCSNGVCQRAGGCPLGQACGSDADCCGGEGCFNGTCEALARPGNCGADEVFCPGVGCCTGGRTCELGACVCPLHAPDECATGECGCVNAETGTCTVCAAGQVCCRANCRPNLSMNCLTRCVNAQMTKCAPDLTSQQCRSQAVNRCCSKRCNCLGRDCETDDDCCSGQCAAGACTD
jgi:hypothetical protein